jgi:biotin carboxyl carrier protein
MYSNMVAQLQALKAEDILPKAMELIPEVRLSAGLPPLVTPTSQIVGAQAVNCALDLKAGRPMYTTKNNQFVSLVKGEYGTTPVPVDAEFRFKICGVREESNYDISKYQSQPNPELPEAGGVKLAENEKEMLLLELFPLVAKPYLTGVKTKAYQAKAAAEAPAKEAEAVAEPKAQPITGHTIVAPLPGKVIEFKVKVGDAVAVGQEVAVLEAMKMENSITSDAAGYVKQILVVAGENVATDTVLIELGEAPVAAKAEPVAAKAVSGNKVVAPLPGRVISLKVKVGDTVKAGDEVAVLEAMKMENSITSDYDGTVLQVSVAEGDNVATDAVLMIVG